MGKLTIFTTLGLARVIEAGCWDCNAECKTSSAKVTIGARTVTAGVTVLAVTAGADDNRLDSSSSSVFDASFLKIDFYETL